MRMTQFLVIDYSDFDYVGDVDNRRSMIGYGLRSMIGYAFLVNLLARYNFSLTKKILKNRIILCYFR